MLTVAYVDRSAKYPIETLAPLLTHKVKTDYDRQTADKVDKEILKVTVG